MNVAYVYPWDIVGDPSAPARLADLGVDVIALAASYHSTRAATPYHPEHRVLDVPHPAFYLPIRPRAWSRLVPAAPTWTPPDAYLQAQTALRKAGLKVHAWTVLTHNSYLGTRFPDLTVRNAFGDPYPYALCPAHEDVLAYCETLVTEILTLAEPDGLILEACGPMGFGHQSVHEKTSGADWTPTDADLLSLCFCTACAPQYPPGTAARVRTTIDRPQPTPGPLTTPATGTTVATTTSTDAPTAPSSTSTPNAPTSVDATSGDPASDGPESEGPPSEGPPSEGPTSGTRTLGTSSAGALTSGAPTAGIPATGTAAPGAPTAGPAGNASPDPDPDPGAALRTLTAPDNTGGHATLRHHTDPMELALGPLANEIRATRVSLSASLRRHLISAARRTAPNIPITLHANPNPWATGAFAALPSGDPDLDVLVGNCWGDTTTDAARLTALANLRTPGQRVGAYVLALPPRPADAATLAGQLKTYAKAGASEFHLYHAGLASRHRLSTIATALRLLQ
ncbi:hypothetical protein [Nonomuraea sp. NPDC049607]|uniref:hypothetical protein n=1 Tax=Nonomuraea sp. NPDC049607 TaxID=3154732 RepID=UPI003445A6A2